MVSKITRFKRFIREAEEDAPDILYHVTAAKNVPKIKKEGLLPNKSKLGFTKNRMGGTLSKKGYVYAFEELTDALRWIFKACWDINKGEDLNVYRIFKIADNKNRYEQDTHWESLGGKGRWMMAEGAISPNALTLLPEVPAGKLIKDIHSEKDLEG